MNPLATRFNDYLTNVTGGDKLAAAILVLAEVIGSLTANPVPALPPPESPDLLTVAQAAAKMNLSSRTVYELCLRGRLRPIKINEHIYVSLSEIQRFWHNATTEDDPNGDQR